MWHFLKIRKIIVIQNVSTCWENCQLCLQIIVMQNASTFSANCQLFLQNIVIRNAATLSVNCQLCLQIFAIRNASTTFSVDKHHSSQIILIEHIATLFLQRFLFKMVSNISLITKQYKTSAEVNAGSSIYKNTVI